MSKITGNPLAVKDFLNAAYGESDYYLNEFGQVVGYSTWFSGLYVCLTCGHLCDCHENEN